MATERRLIDANALKESVMKEIRHYWNEGDGGYYLAEDVIPDIDLAPTVDAVEVVHGRWILTAHEEQVNYRWSVTAECSECHHKRGTVYAGFFTGFPTDIARDIVLEHAESVKLDNYCPNCGAKMDGDGNG